MNSINEMEKKRAILNSALLQFSPDVQSIKKKAIDSIIIQLIAEMESTDRNGEILFVSARDIRDSFSNNFGYSLSLLTIQDSAIKLSNERLLERNDARQPIFRLAPKTRDSFIEDVRKGDKLLKNVVVSIFPNIDKNLISQYSNAFLFALCTFFSENQEIALKLMMGESTSNLFKGSVLSEISKIVINEFEDINYEVFKNGLTNFFSNTADPEYSQIKWNIAQYLHAAKALGLDNEGKYLSAEIFINSTFYLDTNILIPALEDTHKHYKTFEVISKACKKISAKLFAAEITIDELTRWVHYQKDLVTKTMDKIPEGTLPKIRSLFIEKLSDEINNGNRNVSIDELFSGFDEFRDKIENDLEIYIDNAIWFEENENKPNITILAKILMAHYLKKRNKNKPFVQAQHDALMLTYLNKINKECDNNIFLISADLSLTEGHLPGIDKIPIISLDGLLTWLAPLTVDESISFPSLFAKMIKQKVLPNEKIFDLEDFKIFADIEFNTKVLPQEDVEACIQHIKANGIKYNPRNPEDRESLFYNIRKFFADPGREFKNKLDKLLLDNEELKRRNYSGSFWQ